MIIVVYDRYRQLIEAPCILDIYGKAMYSIAKTE